MCILTKTPVIANAANRAPEKKKTGKFINEMH